MNTFAKRLQFIMEEKNIKQAELVEKTGIGKSSISTYLSGNYEPKQNNIYKIAKALNVSINYLMGWENEKENKISKGIKVAVLGDVAAGIPIDAITDILDYEEISEEMAKIGDYFGLRIKGDSMLPRMTSGDVVIVRKQDDIESGDIAVVLVNGDSATVKKVVKSDSGIMLVATNHSVFEPKFYTNEEIEKLPIKILGKVVELRAKF